MQQAPSEHKETPLAEGWPSSGTGCPESLWSLPLGGNQKLLGHSPGHSALSVPAWAGFGPEGHKRSLPTSASLWFSQDRLLVAGTFLCNWIYGVVVLLKVDCQLSLEITKCRWAFHQPPWAPASSAGGSCRQRAPNLAAGCWAGCMLRPGNWAVPQRCPLLQLLSTDLIKFPALCCIPSVTWGKICKAAFGRQCESYS